MINVTRTYLPPIEEYTGILNRSWGKHWITNRGELILELEKLLIKHLAVKNILCTNNGTVPLQIAIKLLARQGEVITTPFSYVATTASIVWENCTPVFVDIDPHNLSIDEEKIEAAITTKTSAILATHVFGNPCNVKRIEEIAKKHNLKVIYDAAHCFGVEYEGKSIFNYGDISTCSFHATKVFHTGEGGAIFCADKELFNKAFYSHNFGHNGPLDFHGLGVNGKMSELQAAMGLAVLPYMFEILENRKRVVELYNKNVNFQQGGCAEFKIRKGTTWNYSYYPVLFKNENQLIRTFKKLEEKNVYPRRYFYPSLNTLKYVPSSPMPISESIASRIACLPLYPGLSNEEALKICDIVNKSIL